MIDAQTLQTASPAQKQLADAHKQRQQRFKRVRAVNTAQVLCIHKYRMVVERWPSKLHEIGGPPTVRRIIAEVSNKHGVTIRDLISPRRGNDLVAARHEAMWRCRHETIFSLPQIGRFFNRDHTSIMYGIAKHEERMADQATARDQSANIKRCLAKTAPLTPFSVKNISINSTHDHSTNSQ